MTKALITGVLLTLTFLLVTFENGSIGAQAPADSGSSDIGSSDMGGLHHFPIIRMSPATITLVSEDLHL